MARHRRIHNRIHQYFRPQKPRKEFILLDKFSVADIRKWRDIQDQILRLHWDFYSSLAYQRSKIIDKINRALLDAAQNGFQFDHWQRAVKYKYALEPFSAAGSLIDPGGRFNIGDINPSQFPPFPALYFAIDKETALQELLSQKITPDKEHSALDAALVNPTSIASVSLSGKLDSVINLREPEKLQPFVDLIKDFSIPACVYEATRKLQLPEAIIIKTVPLLIESLLSPDWRLWPMQFDVPVASQVFGQLVSDAGIEGIIYPSKFTEKDCLAIFPQNFEDTSYVQLDDEAPAEIKIRRLDLKTWRDHLKC